MPKSRNIISYNIICTGSVSEFRIFFIVNFQNVDNFNISNIVKTVNQNYSKSAQVYTSLYCRWSIVGKMEEPRFSMGTVVFGGLIYLVGGCTHTRRHMQELVSYNPVRISISIN